MDAEAGETPENMDESTSMLQGQLEDSHHVLLAKDASREHDSLLPKPSPDQIALSSEQRAMAEKELVRKIDLRLLPLIIIMYVLNYLDRNAIAAARLAGLEEDLGLHGTQYQTAVGILFVGYLLMQVPSNLFLSKIGQPRIYLSSAMIVWGSVSAATAFVHSFTGLIAVRFFLGFCEAAFFPGCLFWLSSFYNRKELGLRTAILFSGSFVSGAFSGVITAGIVKSMDGIFGIRAWRWLFLLEGYTTILVAIVAIFILPDFPHTTTWLSPQEKRLAIWRLQEDTGKLPKDKNHHESLWSGFKLAILDIKVWILMLILFCNAYAASVAMFFPTVVATLGYDDITSLLLTTPPYILCVITALGNAWHADLTGERYLHITLPLYVAIATFALAATTNSIHLRYLSMLFMIPGVYTGYAVALGWISNTIPSPSAKRASALAAINAVSNLSATFSSYMFPISAGPKYVFAMTACSVAGLIAILAATLLRHMLQQLNKELDREEHRDLLASSQAGPEDFTTEVDPEARAATTGFRYLL